MPMVRLIYASRMPPEVGLNDLQAILESARKNNRPLGVTGLLCYDPHYFIQWIEGPRKGVNEIFRRIAKDDRHTDLTLLDYREVSARSFPSWSMGYIMADEMDPKVLFRYSPSPEFDPFALSADSAANLMIDLSEHSPKTRD